VERGRTKKASLYVFDGRERTRTSCFASVHCVDRFPALKQQFLLYISSLYKKSECAHEIWGDHFAPQILHMS
jgi:hypothetical protein